ncbi:hypothetical protein KL929_001530 [Ogataea haglerorum]|nr:hypothetical protein KL951_000914 [Ogataea haglerorum]KAG7748276.1 hypothetical protein KL912_002181 [Ogataea haglerorum]KAG7791739.1 hypothetical protein KL910_001865 [Ogataea haglerorum]KAG7792484.1 hypothetical protein KL945_000765 [Ogataea haglerorum]KAG7798487.1 hypothetical protein KL929_001530 [Ogataea haglerorum]
MLFRGPIARACVRPAFAPSTATRGFQSVYHVESPIIDDSKLENQILGRAYNRFVPEHGFTRQSVDLAIADLQLRPENLGGLFGIGLQVSDVVNELIMYHLKHTRANLSKYHDEAGRLATEGAKVRFYMQKRLLDNVPIIKYYHQALGRMILPTNLGTFLTELQNLSDDITYYSGDKSNDFAWYSKRFALAGAFVQSELFMVGDTTPDHSATISFMNDRVSDIETLGYAYNSMEEWAIFNGISLVNLIKSQLARG